MEASDELSEVLLWPLFNLREVDAGPPFLATSDELTNNAVDQILKIGNTSWLNQDCATPFKVAGR